MAHLTTSFSSLLSQRAVKSEPQWSQPQPSGALTCENCGCDDIYDGDDGHFYCRACGSMMGHLVVTADAAEDIVGVGAGPDGGGQGAIYSQRHRINVAPSTSSQPAVKQEVDTEGDISFGGRQASVKEECRFEGDADGPIDFGSGSTMDDETLVNGIGLRYVQGVQLMVQMQCEALVVKFGANPLICKVVEGIWLRFVASKRVFDRGWANKVIQESEVALREQAGEDEPTCRTWSLGKRQETHNMYGHRAVYIWLKALKKAIPLHTSLAISLLACHIARESVLPTDIVKWALEAELPYISAFVNIDKMLGRCPKDCPLGSKIMFKPSRVAGVWQLERLVAIIANSIGLHLPPVNFYAIARRYLKELSVPLENILPTACKIYEWSMPAELCFSTHTGMIPTRAYVLAILIITIRLLYNIHGQGVWEKQIAPTCSSSNQIPTVQTQHQNSMSHEDGDSGKSHVRSTKFTERSKFNTEELLLSLETIYNKINIDHVPDYSRDYSSYLKYCKEIICAGIDKSYEEESLMQKLWTMHKNAEDEDHLEDEIGPCNNGDLMKDERGRNGSNEQLNASESQKNERTHVSFGPKIDSDAMHNKALQKLKRDMEFHGFHYLHPKVKRLPDGHYLSYRRKRMFGRWYYVAHADYYLLLRTCAKLCQVDCRVMHMAVLSVERRFCLIETRILSSLISLYDGSLESMIEQTQELVNDDGEVREMDDEEIVVRLI